MADFEEYCRSAILMIAEALAWWVQVFGELCVMTTVMSARKAAVLELWQRLSSSAASVNVMFKAD